jgi:Flavodoxin-like fold
MKSEPIEFGPPEFLDLMSASEIAGGINSSPSLSYKTYDRHKGAGNENYFYTACETLTAAGNQVRISALHEMRFDPVSSRKNFTTVKNPNYFKQQAEEIHVNEAKGFSKEIASEMGKIEWCDLMIWQFPLWWFGLPAVLKEKAN